VFGFSLVLGVLQARHVAQKAIRAQNNAE